MEGSAPILSSTTSCVFVVLSQISLTLIPRRFSSVSLPTQVSLAALLLLVITGIGNNCRRVLHLYASAPAFVLFNILFIWGVHVTIIRKEISLIWIVAFNVECAILVFGFYSIIFCDPGVVAHGDGSLNELIQNEVSGVKSSTEEDWPLKTDAYQEQTLVKMEEVSSPMRRIRYCKYCKGYRRGFDHHCPAFGNCIGQENHLLFMALLVGFVMVEASYIVCSTQFITRSRIMDKSVLESISGDLAISTRLFAVLQVLWQVLFLTWHIYCVCVNIKTDEWINWRKYPEFQSHVHLQPGHLNLMPRFRNPYDKGVLDNIKEFLSPKR